MCRDTKHNNAHITEKNYVFKHYHDSEQISVSVDTKVTMQRHQPIYVCIFSLFSHVCHFEITMTTTICERKFGKSIDKYNYLGSSYWCWQKKSVLYVKSERTRREIEEKNTKTMYYSFYRHRIEKKAQRKIICIHNPDYPKC